MTVLVTGASSGFGKEISKIFVKAGYSVIGASRRTEQLGKLQRELGKNFLPLEMDLCSYQSVDQGLASLKGDWEDIDLLINNAGLALGLEPAHQTEWIDWEIMVQTNISGLLYVTRKLLPALVRKRSGHIINIGSTAGSYPYYGANVYGASKAFVKQFSKNLRADLADKGIRITNVEPGLCGETEFSQVRFKGDEQKARAVYREVNYLKPQDIAEIVLWIYQQPTHVNINSIEIMPVAQTFAGLMVHRDDKKV
ncbi:MAG: SDR family oxidoreductase [Neisseriaceae bacterium]